MSKMYQYRKYIRWGQYVIPIIFLIIVVFFVFLGVKLFALSQELSRYSAPFQAGILVFTICLPTIFAVEGIFSWYLYYRLAGVQVILENDSIVYKHRGGETKVNFTDITKISLPSIPYLGGWITIIAGKEKIRLTVVVNEIGDFVQTLKASLDKLGLTNRYDESKLFLFLKTAVFSDQSWDRLHVIFWKFILFTFGTGFLGFTITKISGTWGFFWVLFSFIYPTLVYTGTEILFGRRIAKTATREAFFVPPRDITYETRVYKIAIIVGSVLYIILALIMIFL